MLVTDGPALLADRGRDLSEVCPTSTAHLEHDVTDPGVQRREHRDASTRSWQRASDCCMAARSPEYRIPLTSERYG